MNKSKITFTIAALIAMSSCHNINISKKCEVKQISGAKLPALEPIFLGTGDRQTSFWTAGQKTVRQSGDRATIFYREVEENITTPRGQVKGYIELTHKSDWAKSFLCTIPSALTAMTINLFGFPLLSLEGYSEINVRILDANGQFIKRYSANATSTQYVALWWGVAESSHNGESTSIIAYKKALDDITLQIKKDHNFLAPLLK